MRQVELLDQLLVGAGFVERVEVLPVQVLHESLFEAHGVVGLVHEGRDRLQPSPPRGPEATFARDQFELVRTDLTHEHGLEDADGLDGVDEGGEALLAELVARLERVRPDSGEGNLAEHRLGRDTGRRRDEGSEPLSEAATPGHH